MTELSTLTSLVTRVYPPRYKSQELFIFGASIILEDPAIIPRQQQVRILLVYKKVPSCDPLILRRLAFTTADVRRQPPYLSINRPTHFGTSLPTITVEVYFEKTPELAYAALRVIHSVTSLSDFAVAYGWIQDFSEDSRSCTVAFESNWPFHKVPEFALPLAISHVRTRAPPTDHRAAVRFDVRVFSPHKSRLNSKMVFSGVIARTIGQHLILDWQTNWRTDLLNFGLTCKSTSTALIAFFEIQREECLRYLGSDKPSIDAVLSSLRWRPDRANLIRCMAPTFYKEFPRPITGHEYAASCEAFIQLLSSAKEVKQLTLSYIPPTLYSQLVQSLQNLQNLELFDVKFDVKANSTRPGNQNLSFLPQDVFKFLSRWPRLHTIDVELRSPAFVIKREPEADVPLKTACNLRTLSITNSKMAPLDLLRFLPTSEPPRLNRLHLASVTGIGKGEIKTFLRSVAPVIVDIHISGCRFLTAADEESATLDETLSSMPLLKNLTITTSGNLVGVSCIYARENRIPGSNLRVTNSRPFRRHEVIDALRSSKWDKVVVAWDSPDHDGEALRVAKQRGVEFASSLVV